MPDGSIDVGSLAGDALTRWYLRSPAEIELERQDAAAKRYQDFFYGPSGADPDAGFAREAAAADRDVDPDFAVSFPSTSQDIDPGFTWAQVGPNRFRGVRLIGDDHSGDPSPLAHTSYGGSTPSEDPGTIAQYQDAGPPEIAAPQLNLAAQPVAQFDGELRAPPTVTFGPARSPAAQGVPQTSSYAPQDARPVAASHPAIRTPVHLAPATPPLPTFFSSLFGGPVPLTSPEGHVVGYYDHQAAKAGLGITAQYAQIAPWFQPAGWMDGLIAGGGAIGGKLLSALGPEAETAVAEGIAESPAAKAATQAFHRHHPEPVYMGGAADQERVLVEDKLHHIFHSMLGKAHWEAGFPPRGGISGSAVKWAKHFELNPGSRDEAFEILRRVSREFDEIYKTNISSKLPRTPGSTELGPPPSK